MRWYTAGTVTLTNGLVTVTGTGTQFLDNVHAGDVLMVSHRLYEIISVQSDTQLTLGDEYNLTTAHNAPYAVIRNFTNAANSDLMLAIDEFLTDRQRDLTEFVTWVNGTFNGGPDGDGKYPLTDRYGVVRLVKCPERMQFESASGGGSGGGSLVGAGVTLATTYGLIGGATRDETVAIGAAIDAAGNAGGGVVIIRSANGTDPVYINGPINIEHSDVTARFVSPLIFGPDAYIRINGNLSDMMRPGQTEQLALRADATTDMIGRMVLPLRAGNGAFVQPGDRITIRGLNDAAGRALEKQVTAVLSVDGDDITCVDEPEFNFRATYPDSPYTPDLTTGTTVSISVFSRMTADNSMTDTVELVSTAGFAIGDLAYISDNRTEADLMAPVVTALRNAAAMEILRIVDIQGQQVTFERPLQRQYLTSFAAGITKINAIQNSHIEAGLITWSAPQPNRKNPALSINYGAGCTLSVKRMNGRAGRIGMGARVSYGYDCHVIDSGVYDAYSYGSGEGYGIALYYSTLCSIKNCVASGGRHNFLLQTTTSCDITNNVSNDDWISGIDVHGAGAISTRITGNRVSRSRNYAPAVTNGGGIRNGNTAHTIGDHQTLIANNYIEGYLGSACAAIDVSPSSRGVVVRNNEIVDSQIGVRHYKVGSGISPSQRCDRVIIDGNSFTRVVQPLNIDNYSNSTWDEVVLTGNKSIENAQHFAIRNVPKVLAVGNQVIAPKVSSNAAFDFFGITSLRAFSNVSDETAIGVRVQNCPDAKVIRNFLGEATSEMLDAGGNAGLVAKENGYAQSGSGVSITRFNGNLGTDTLSSLTIPMNFSTPNASLGLTALEITAEVVPGRMLEIVACVPYVSMGGSSGPCIAHLFANGEHIGTAIKRLTASTSPSNTGGEDFVIVTTHTPIDTEVVFKLQIGPVDNSSNQVLLNNRYAGATQPYLILKEYG